MTLRRPKKLNKFTKAYIEAALWASVDNADESGGEPLDANYGIADIATETLRQMVKDCVDFYRSNRKDIRASGIGEDRAGHDFWLTRNRHGSGFWDEKSRGPAADKALDRLTEESHAYGSYDLYIGDDGQVHGS